MRMPKNVGQHKLRHTISSFVKRQNKFRRLVKSGDKQKIKPAGYRVGLLCQTAVLNKNVKKSNLRQV